MACRLQVEAHHYCSCTNDEVRQCVIYDSANSNARLIGIEYIISRRLFESLPEEEKKLWHSHTYEVWPSPTPNYTLLRLPVTSAMAVGKSAWSAGQGVHCMLLTLTPSGHTTTFGEAAVGLIMHAASLCHIQQISLQQQPVP